MNLYLEPVAIDAHSPPTSVWTRLTHLLSALRSHGRTPAPSPPFSSTSFFSFLLCPLIALQVHQFFDYVIPLIVLLVTYKWMKFIVLTSSRYWQERVAVNCFVRRATTFVRVRYVKMIYYLWGLSFHFSRRQVLIPSPLYALRRSLIQIDQRCNRYLQSSIDYLVSASMILILCLTLLFGSVLLLQQVRSARREYLFDHHHRRILIRFIMKVSMS